MFIVQVALLKLLFFFFFFSQPGQLNLSYNYVVGQAADIGCIGVTVFTRAWHFKPFYFCFLLLLFIYFKFVH